MKNFKTIAVVAVVVTAVAVAVVAVVQWQKNSKILAVMDTHRLAVANKFLDPESVKFRSMKGYTHLNATGETMYALCGESNAKNGFGAYTGYKRFVVTARAAKPDPSVFLGDPDSDMDGPTEKICQGKLIYTGPTD